MAIPMQRLGWMAGIVDLKGRIATKQNKTRVTPQVTLYVESKELSIIRSLSEMTGTRPEMKAAEEVPAFMRHQCVEHCPEKHTHVAGSGGFLPRTGRWTISGAAMVVVLYNLKPFLVVDKNWDLIMDQVFNVTVSNGRGFMAVKTALIRLRDLGWELPILFQVGLLEDEEEVHEQDQPSGSTDSEALGTFADYHDGEGPEDI